MAAWASCSHCNLHDSNRRLSASCWDSKDTLLRQGVLSNVVNLKVSPIMSFLGECNVYSDSVSLQQSVDHDKSLDVRALLLSFSKLILSHGQILPTIHIYKRTLRDNSSLYEYIQWAASVGYLYKEQKAHRLFIITLDLQRKEHYWFFW